MLESLLFSSKEIGLQLNSEKTTILTTRAQTAPLCLDVNGDMIEILHSADSHADLGRLLFGDLASRNAVELTDRTSIRVAWGSFMCTDKPCRTSMFPSRAV